MDTSITVKVIFGLFALLIVVRILGKKELSQLTPIDFVYLLVLGGLLEESIYDDLVSIWEVLYTIALWALLIYIIEMIIRKFEVLRPVLKGEPSIIVDNGELVIKALKRNKLELEQLRSLLRQQGIFSLKEVKYAILEPGGQLSVMKKDSESAVTAEMLDIHSGESSLSHLLIDEGEIEYKILKSIGKDKEWLIHEMNKRGYDDITNIYYAEWSEENGFIIETND
ncbi:DUF421 domain-containing protein [Oceanobacillus piezotolerans]|uniref:DUF421 domain-containing protein n=1 Tax=Oceanobacillus piezotolerans TaxID=2448030 RepID=A0A498DM05_9BACI|nr:DUF421 domain-containing protein [Oceanobacillus piezotolerans]RLL44822.1 DUF421 domain-containing protein [Oceanobacillus piezotolerans]